MANENQIFHQPSPRTASPLKAEPANDCTEAKSCDPGFEVHFADPFHLSAQPLMRCWMAWAKTSRGMYYATVGLPVIEEREINELGSDVHREWMNMQRATLVFRLARNVAKRRDPVLNDLQEVVFEE